MVGNTACTGGNLQNNSSAGGINSFRYFYGIGFKVQGTEKLVIVISALSSRIVGECL